MSNHVSKIHGRMRLLNGMSFNNNADIVAEPGLLATFDGMPCLYTTIQGIEAWYPLAKGVDNVTYRHTQTISSDHWVVQHDLETEDVWYIIRDGDGDMVATTLGVNYDEVDPQNKLHFYFATPITGSVFIIGTRAFSSPVLNTGEINLGNGVTINNNGITVNGQVISMTDLLNSQQSIDSVNALMAQIQVDMSALSADVSNEVTRATAAENSLRTDLTTTGNNLAAESTRAQTAELAIAADVATLQTSLSTLDAAALKTADLVSEGGLVVDLVGGKIPANLLPGFVDDVLEYTTITQFPVTGEAGKLYVALDNNKTYRWSGSVYVEVSAAPGSSDAVPEGSTNLYFTVARAQAAVTSVSGNAGTATKLQTARAIALSGVVSGTANFDGSAGITITTTMNNSGVSAGSYGDSVTIPTYTVGLDGRLTAAGSVAIREASTTQAGIVQLTTATNSTSNTLAAAASAVKAAYDLATTANNTANAAIPATQKGVANGVATLDVNGLVPSSQLPSYVDDVLEYNNLAALPGTGTAGKIYVTLDTNKTYRWSGSVYVEISASPGSTDAVTEGSVNLYFTAARAQAAVTTITGNAGTATKLQTARTLAVSGDATGSASFDGSANATISVALAAVGTAGTYAVVTTDSKGRVTAGRALQVSDLPATVVETDQNQTFSKAQRGAVSTLAYAATLTLDLATSNNFEVTLTGNTTLGLPNNIVPGQSGMLRVMQDATGSRTMAFNSAFKFAGGTAASLTTTANAVDYLCYYVESATRILLSVIKDAK